MFDAITRACRWARETVFKPLPGQARAAEGQSSRDIAKPRGRRPAALIASILGLALTAVMATGAAAQTAPTGSSSLSSSVGTIGTPFTLTITYTQNHAAPAIAYVGAYNAPNTNYVLPAGVTVASSTAITNSCNFALPGLNVGATGFSGVTGSTVAQGTTCTLAVSVVASTSGAKIFNRVGGAALVGGVGVNTTGDLGLPGTITIAAPPAPTLSFINPNAGLSTGGESIALNGSNLTGATAVTFGGTAATSFVVDHDGLITAVAPAHAEGDVNVVVTTPGGSATMTNGYIYVLKPTITAVNPSTGSSGGGSFTTTITGTNFVSGQMTVFFDGVTADAVAVMNSTTMIVSPPAHVAGTVDVTVRKRGVFADETLSYTYVATPTVTSLSSVYGTNAGGQSLTITGTNLTGATGVTIGGTAATGLIVDSATQIRVTTPAHAAGVTDVLVTTAGGTSANTSADNFTYLAPPTLSLVISPSTATTSDDSTFTLTVTNPNGVALTGFNMTGVPLDTSNFGLNGLPANTCGGGYTFGPSGLNTSGGTVPANGTCSLTAPVRAFAAGTYSIGIASTYNNTGNFTGPGATSNTYTVTPPAPSISAVSAHARVAGGTSIIITGSNLSGATAVTFGGVNATSYVVNSNSQITAVAPAQAMGVVDIQVTTAGGTTANTSADDITYVAPPTASLVFSPSTVVTLQTSTLTITLTNPNPTVTLTGVAMAPSAVQPYLGLFSSPTTTCGGAGGMGYDEVNGLSTGGYSIPAGGSCTYTLVMRGFRPDAYTFSVGTIAVINQGSPSGPGATSNVLTVNPASPTVTAVSPTSGPLAGGTSVVITGTNFASVSGVTFGGVNATGFTVDSTTQITATAPAGVGTVDVQVTNVTGTSATSAADQYTWVAAPVVTGDPSNASINAGSDTTFTASASGSTSVQWQVSTDGSGSAFVDISNTPGAYAGATTNTLTVTGQMSRHFLLYRAVFTNAGGSATSANATLSVTPTPPVVSATLSDTTILAGQTTTLTLSMTNPNDRPLAGVFGFAGNPNFQNYALPAGVTVSGVGTINCSGSNNFSGDQGQVIWSQVPANSGTTCSTTVELTSASSGTYSLADLGHVLQISGASVTGSVSVPALIVVDTPSISSISPQAGPVAGGTNVTISGTNFTPTSTVSFGGTPAASVSFVSSTTLTAVSPAGTGTVDVSVTNLAGTSADTAADNFTYVEAPVVTQIDPLVGPESGNWNVYLIGQNFTPDTTVTFGGVPANSVDFTSSTFISANAPAGTGVVDVIATNAGGSSANTAADNFTYVPRPSAPVISSPTNGSFTNSYPTVSGTADPNAFVNLFLNGSPMMSVTANGSGNWTIGGVLSVPEGEHTLRASVTNDGGTSPDSNIVTFTFDASAPNEPVIDTPADGSATTNRSPTYSGTAEANAVIEVTVSSNFIGTTTADGTGAWSITEPTILFVGSHLVQARATDPAGNQSSYSGGNTFTVYVEPNLSIDDVTVTEGDTLNFTVSLDGPAGPGGVTFDVNVTPDTAGVSDFMAPPLTGLTIPEGQNSYLVAISAVDDSLYELSEDFYVTVANVTGAVVTDADGYGTITNNDTAPQFAISDVTMSEGNGGTTLFTFTISKTGDTQRVAFVNFATSDGTATVADNDYLPTSGTLLFNPSDTTYSLAIAVAGDLLYENNEAFFVNLSSAVDAGISDGQGAGTIVNDDAMPFLSVNDVAANEGNAGTTAFVFTASLNAPSSIPVTVDYGTVGLTATDGSDFTGVSGTFTFLPGETIKTATVLVNGDNALEPNETFAFNLSAASNAAFADNQGIGTIVNDDVAPPNAPVTVSPANGSVISDNNPTISGTAEPGTVIDVIIDGASVGTAASNGAGNWFFSSYAPLADGPHTVRATSTNSGGTSPSSNTNTFTVDTTAPAAPVVIAPANGSVTADNTPTLSGTAEPGSTVTVIVDGTAAGTATATGAGSWSFTSSTPLAEGPHTIRATATDAAGNSSPTSATNTFTVDTAAPAAPVVTAPANGAITGDNTPTYSGAAEPGSTVTISVGGSAVGTTTTDGAGNWSFTPSVPLADDFYSVRATATDAVGNVSSNSMSNSFRVDTTAPASPVTLNPANGSVTADNTPPYSGTAEPNTTVTVIIDGSPIGTTGSGAGGNWSFSPFAPLADGPHTFRATATDSAGNTSPTSNTNTFTVDTAAPAAPVVATPANGSSSTNPLPTYSGTAEPGSTVTVTIDSGATVGNVTVDGMGNWAYVPSSPLALGAHTVRASSTDGVGNTSADSSTISFTIVPFAPVAGPVSASVAYGSTNNPITLSLSGGATDSVTVATPATHGTATATGASITYTPTAGYAGPDSFTYTATNAGGTSAPATVTVTVGSPTLALNPASVPAATVGTAYSQTLTASGGAAPYSYAVTSGALPAGVTLSPGGELVGTPTAGGSFNATITATDSSTGTGPFTASRAYALTVNAPTISVSPMSDPATVGQSFNRTMSAIGGTGPYSFAISAGALPAGMSLSPSGQLSGTPTAGGTFNYTVTATDSSTGTGPYTGSRAYALVVGAANLNLPTASLTAGAVTAPYTGQLPSASGGTAPYSYAVTAGDFPAGMTLSSTGALSGTPTAGGTFLFNVQATDSSTGSGPYSTTQTYSLTIAAPTIVVGPTTLPDGIKAIAYAPQTITASGGVAPYSYALTAGALPDGLTLSPAGVLSGTPTENGTFGFTVTATDSATGNGPYTGSRAYSLIIALDPPTANPVSLSVGYNSANNPVTLNLTGGAANSLAIGSAPSNGVATVSGLSITYTPNSGYFGPDSFTYTATNGSGTSVPATVSVTVGLPPAPTASGTSVSVPYAGTGTAIDLTSQVAGVSTGVSVASAPSHGTVSVAGYVITYTPSPTYFGPDSFTYVAVGPGGNSVPATVSLTVANPPPPVVTPTPPTPVPPTTGGSSTVNLQTQVGGVVTGWRITVAPTNGSAAIEGAGPAPAPAMPGEGPQSTGPALTLRYTPATGFMGTDTVTLVAEGPGGDSAPVTFTFQVPGMAPNRTATLASNTVSTINATSGLTGGPFNSVQITRAPSFGTAVVSGLNIVFTPGAPNAGPTYLEYTVTTPGGTSAIGRIDYTVNRAPGAQTLVVSTPAGRPVTVSLTANAVGGPFTGAAIVNLSIPTAGAAVLTQGGVAGNRTYDLTFTPAGTFTGRVDVNFTLTNAFATESGVVQVTVTTRPDPSVDPDVRGLVSSQTDSARRFADTQIDNFSRRLEQLRDGDNASASNLSLNLNMGGQSEVDPRAAARRRLGDQQASEDGLSLMETRARDEEADAFAQFGGRNGQAPTETDSAAAHSLGAVSAQPQGQGSDAGHSVGVWAGGGIEWGRRDAEGQRDTRFTSSGISAGLDVKLTDSLIVGAGLGYGEDRTRIGSNDTTSDGSSSVGAVYAAWQAPNDIHLEGVFGYGSLDYTSRRWSTAASAFAFGERSGDMTFGSLGLAQEHRSAGMSRAFYARVDAQSVTLDAFTETGAGIYALTYDTLEFDALSSTLGMRMDWQVEGRDSLFVPSVRFEWSHEFDEVGSQTVSYADWLASPRYGLDLDSWSRNRFALDLEGRWTFETMEVTAGYRGTTSSDTISHGVQIKLTTRF